MTDRTDDTQETTSNEDDPAHGSDDVVLDVQPSPRVPKPVRPKPERLMGAFLGDHRGSIGLTPVAGQMGFVIDGETSRFDVRPLGTGDPAPPIETDEPAVKQFLSDVHTATVAYAAAKMAIKPVPKTGRVVDEGASDNGRKTCPLCHGGPWEPECYVCNGVGTISEKALARWKREN